MVDYLRTEETDELIYLAGMYLVRLKKYDQEPGCVVIKTNADIFFPMYPFSCIQNALNTIERTLKENRLSIIHPTTDKQRPVNYRTFYTKN